MENDKKNLIGELTCQCAPGIPQFSDLLESKRKYTMANQLFRSAPGIGANVKKAQSAESKTAFIHKMKTASTKAEETEYWLKLPKHSKSYTGCSKLLLQIISISKIPGKIISSSKK
jgi:four helix bundle protein